MSSLTEIERLYLEKFLEMEDGYVLSFSNATFEEFFNGHKIDIHGPKYQVIGTSKAKKLRAFWNLESDQLVGKILTALVDLHEAQCDLNGQGVDKKLLVKVREIVGRLTGRSEDSLSTSSDQEFLALKFVAPNIQRLPIDSQVVPIIETRLAEAGIAFDAGAHLSVIFLCGSILEAILLGVARQNPASFNKANASPRKSDGSPKQFPDWSLAQLIDVACEIGALKVDIKKFSHGLRDFRNYIHPYEQLISHFTPDKHTASLCLQVLKAAFADLCGER